MPVVIGNKSEFILSISVYCLQLFRSLLNKFRCAPFIPYFILSVKVKWSMV